MKPRLKAFGGIWYCQNFYGPYSYSGGGLTPELAYQRWRKDIPWWRRLFVERELASTNWTPNRVLPPAPRPSHMSMAEVLAGHPSVPRK